MVNEAYGIRDVGVIRPIDDMTVEERVKIEQEAEKAAANALISKKNSDVDVHDVNPVDVGKANGLWDVTLAPAGAAVNPATLFGHTLTDEEAFTVYGYEDPDREVTRIEIHDQNGKIYEVKGTERLHSREFPIAYFRHIITIVGQNKKLIVKVYGKTDGATITVPMLIKRAIIAGTEWGAKANK